MDEPTCDANLHGLQSANHITHTALQTASSVMIGIALQSYLTKIVAGNKYYYVHSKYAFIHCRSCRLTLFNSTTEQKPLSVCAIENDNFLYLPPEDDWFITIYVHINAICAVGESWARCLESKSTD